MAGSSLEVAPFTSKTQNRIKIHCTDKQSFASGEDKKLTN